MYRIDPTNFRVETGFDACFSADHIEVEFSTGGSGSTLSAARSVGVGSERKIPIPRVVLHALAAQFAGEIKSILTKPDVTCGERSTTRYYAKISDGSKEGKPVVSVSSSGIPKEHLQDFISDPACDPEIARKTREVLDAGYHNWSHEIYAATVRFLRENIHDLDF